MSSFVSVKSSTVTNDCYSVLEVGFRRDFTIEINSACVSNVAVRVPAIKCTDIQLSPGIYIGSILFCSSVVLAI